MSVPVAVWNKIEALEQAHAELAAKVDALLARYDAHVLVHALDELESPAPAPDPEFAPDPNGKRTRPRTSITDDVEKLWPQLEAGVKSLGRKSGESHAPAPDPVCANCHGRKVITNLTQYGDIYDEEPCPDCAVPTAEPAPLDPVLVAIRDLYVLIVPDAANDYAFQSQLAIALRYRWETSARQQTGRLFVHEEADTAIRAYGRDGAR